MIDELDLLMEYVDCTNTTLTATFPYDDTYETLYSDADALKNAALISSHSTCSDEGAHSVFR